MGFVTIRDSYHLEEYRNVGNIRASTGRDKMNFAKSDMATKQQIRNHFADQGCAVIVSNDGRVRFRKLAATGEMGPWLEGRWQAEYRVIDGQIVHK